MKKLFTYIVLLAGAAATLLSCAQQEEWEQMPKGNALTIKAELVSSPAWTTRAADNRVEYGGSAEIGNGEYIITAQKEDWNAHCEQATDSSSVADAPLTRGTPITSVSGIQPMRINVYKTGASNWSISSSRTATIKATYSGGAFTTSPAYNWATDLSSKTTLFTYSPEPSGTNGLSESSTTPHQITYTVPSTVGNQPDFCTAVPDKDVVNSNGTSHVRNIALQHRLTAVGFAMLGWNLKITGITVSGVSMTGTFDMSTSTWSNLGSTGSRNVGVTGNSYTHSHNSSYANITTSSGYLMMIPQTLTDAATVTITYTAVSGTTATGGSITAKLKDLGVTWEPGDKITYNIRLKTAPAVTSGDLTITTHLAGYTTSSPMTVVTDGPDNLTFTWSANWLKIHRGSPTYGVQPSGGFSGWSTGTGDANHSNLYFFATNENSSTTAPRSAQVTVSGTRSGTKIFTVTQSKKRANLVDHTTKPANSYYCTTTDNGVMFNAYRKPITKTGLKCSDVLNLYNDEKPEQVEILWQTAKNHGKTGGEANMTIKSIFYDKNTGICEVETNRGAGNAYLVGKNSNGLIMWGWHIWVVDGAIKNLAKINGVEFMDRNLGALSATSARPSSTETYKYFGLLWQWGRKEPITGQGAGTSINAYTKIFNAQGQEITGGRGGFTYNGSGASSMSVCVQNPMVFYKQSDEGVISGNPNTWSSSGNKSIYDPCPYGYRVPLTSSVWSGFDVTFSGASGTITLGSTWNSSWWPMAGRRQNSDAAFTGVGGMSEFWVSSSEASSAYQLYYNNGRAVNTNQSKKRSFGASIRCVVE